MITELMTSWRNSCSQTVIGVVVAGAIAFPATNTCTPTHLHERMIRASSWNSATRSSCRSEAPSTCPIQAAINKWYDQHEKDIVMATDELSAQALKIIGEHGASRFNSFKEYPEGWGGDGHKLSFASVGAMTYFINSFERPIHNPSIFMSRVGNIQLGWDTEARGYVELEFFSDHVEYYIESKDEESSIPLKDIRKLSALIA